MPRMRNAVALFPSTVEILGVPISRVGLQQALDLSRQAQGYVCFANAHSLSESQKNSAVHSALTQSTFCLADGMPLVWVSRLRGLAIESRVCGPDFAREFLERTQGESHGFIGGAPGQAEAFAQKFGIQGVSYSPPMREFTPERAAEDWKNFLALCPQGKPPRYLWIGLGAPKQELWMHVVSQLAPKSLFFGVGAAFDFLTGKKKRAPESMQKMGLEWLYRFTQEPSRLWKRYLIGNSVFAFLSFLEFLPPLWIVLGLQLLVTVFIPAMSYGSRSLFLGDLLFFIWPPLYLARLAVSDPSLRKPLLRFTLGSAALFGLIYLHGYFRVSIADELAAVNMQLTESERFNPLREFVVAARFLSWLWGGALVAKYKFKKDDFRALQTVLSWALLVAAVGMCLCKFSQDLSIWMGSVYGYDANYWGWSGRVYGFFRSPNEAGVFFGLGLLTELSWEMRLRSRWGYLALAASTLSIFLTQSMTTLVIVFLLISTVLFVSIPDPKKRRILGSFLFLLVATSGGYLVFSPLGWIKYTNFMYRIGPWKVFIKMALSRLDLLGLGFGWVDYNVDNAYLFLLNRGGLLLLLAVVGLLLPLLTRHWRRWSSWQRILSGFLLLSSFTIDSIILRPVVALLVCMGLASLQIFVTDDR